MNVDEAQFLSTMSGGFRPRADWRACTGKGVTVAIVDSGVDGTHPELLGRVVESVEARVDGKRVMFDNSNVGDSAGHGTACAGIIHGVVLGGGCVINFRQKPLSLPPRRATNSRSCHHAKVVLVRVVRTAAIGLRCDRCAGRARANGERPESSQQQRCSRGS